MAAGQLKPTWCAPGGKVRWVSDQQAQGTIRVVSWDGWVTVDWDDGTTGTYRPAEVPGCLQPVPKVTL